MADPKKPHPQQAAQPAVTDLPANDASKDANVKGGALRRGGDDDLDDLEVER